MYNGAVFFDYDGTLADEREGIAFPDSKTVKAINQLKKHRYLIVLATGRAKCYVPDTGIEFDGCITANGAYAEINGVCALNRIIPRGIIGNAISYMDSMGIKYALETPSVCYARDLNDRHFSEVLDNFHIPKAVFTVLDPLDPPEANKILATYESYDIEDDFKEHFKGLLTMKRHRFCTSWDIDLAGVTKADGMNAIIEKMSLPRDNVYAFGDGENDLTMLASAGHGIAMKAHAACLDSVSEYITESVKNDGICKGLAHFGLI